MTTKKIMKICPLKRDLNTDSRMELSIKDSGKEL
jgi:hypothetical protein